MDWKFFLRRAYLVISPPSPPGAARVICRSCTCGFRSRSWFYWSGLQGLQRHWGGQRDAGEVVDLGFAHSVQKWGKFISCDKYGNECRLWWWFTCWIFASQDLEAGSDRWAIRLQSEASLLDINSNVDKCRKSDSVRCKDSKEYHQNQINKKNYY